MKIKNAFEIEKLRSELAERSELEELKKTYTSKFPEIHNKNTPALWDKLNRREELFGNSNYMEKDKLEWVARHIPQKRLKILNIGFGSANLENLKLHEIEKMYAWYGIDISKESVINAIRRFPSANFSVGDITKLSFENNKFDIVIALEVLEHISPKKIMIALKEINRVLKKNGVFISSVPLNEDIETMVKKNENYNEHVRIYTPSLIKAELEMSNFQIGESKQIYAFRNFYFIKSFLVNYFFRNFRHPNGIVIIAYSK